MPTVRVQLADYAGDAGTFLLKLYPRASGVIANGAGGDALAEETNGCFAATVAEALTGVHRADVLRDGSLLYQGWVDMSDAAPVVDDPTVTIDTDAVAAAVADALGDELEVTVKEFTGDALAQLTAAGVEITVSSPIATNGALLTLRKGDDYLHDDGRAIQITLSGTLPDYTDATPRLRVRSGNVNKASTGTVVTPTGSTRALRFEFPATDTAALATGQGKYEIEVTLASGHVTTPVPMPDDPVNNLRVLNTLA